MFCTTLAFSQEILQELLIETSDPPSVTKIYRKCGMDNGVIVFNTTIPDLQFSIPDAPNRLKDVSYSKDDNCYVLCVQPTDTTIGGYTGYIIEIKGKNYKSERYSVSDVKPIQAQYFKINQKVNPNGSEQPQYVEKVRFDNGTDSGDRVKGKRHGQGIFEWYNGDRFEGNYENDKKNGYGKLYSKSKKFRYEGYFVNDEYDGQGTYYNDLAGWRHEGQFKKGKPHGEGMRYNSNGKFTKGVWENGVFKYATKK